MFNIYPQLGYSALVGLGVGLSLSLQYFWRTNRELPSCPPQVILLGFPLQFVLVKILFAQHQKGVKITDQRVQITTEASINFQEVYILTDLTLGV